MTTAPLRSRNWFGRQDMDGFAHRSWLKAEGFSDAMFDGRPVIGIANSWSELTSCNAHLRQVAEVQDGDEIELDVPKRRLTLLVSDGELARRRAAWRPRSPHFTRGYGRLFLDHVLQANEGCDFDFLRGGTPVRLEDTAGPSHA